MESSNNPIKPEASSSTGYKRLPSFRTPRDLKLSDFQKAKLPTTSGSKKVYVPNLNVQRKKPTEDVASIAQEKSTAKMDDKPKKERAKKKTANYIQSSGVFSEGLAPSIKTGRWTSNKYSENSDSPMICRPVLKKPKDGVKVDKDAEESCIKELLRDDFIDDPSILPDMKHCPVQLPLKAFDGEIFKKEADEVKMKIENLGLVPGVKVKEEPGEPPATESVPEPKVEVKPRNLSQMVPLTISQLLSQSTERSFIFFQLPHVLPKEKVFVPAGVKGSLPSTPNSQSEPEECNVLRKLPAGKIGKLQILKSGRARLVLGDAKFYIEPGTQPSFKQDVMAIDLNHSTHSGDMINLGSITSHLIVTPDWHQLLAV